VDHKGHQGREGDVSTTQAHKIGSPALSRTREPRIYRRSDLKKKTHFDVQKDLLTELEHLRNHVDKMGAVNQQLQGLVRLFIKPFAE
jgi:hypothetical protein